MTLRELDRMARARQEADWAQTAEILAMTYNMNRAPKTRGRSADEFNPYRRRRRRPALRLSGEAVADVLRGAFLDGKIPETVLSQLTTED